MRYLTILVLMLVLAVAAYAFAREATRVMSTDRLGSGPLADCHLHYYYHIPVPGYPGASYYWTFWGWETNDCFGTCFDIGDPSFGDGITNCDPGVAQTIELFAHDAGRYAADPTYPGAQSTMIDIYCAPEVCCGPTPPFVHLWSSGDFYCVADWNYHYPDPPVCITDCCLDPLPDCNPSIVVTITYTGYEAWYPSCKFDDPGAPFNTPFAPYALHDIGCLPTPVPRNPCGGADPMCHTGY